MSIRAIFRTLLVSLIVAAHVMGVAAAPKPAVTPTDATYFCCCVGECSCTADCCNHDPGVDVRKENGTGRVGLASPALQSPKSCGIWIATTQRNPEQPSAARATAPKSSLAGSDETGLRDSTPSCIPTDGSILRDLSPRAPPTIGILS